jgi:LmbE family N-acetylglucosaminyl deacetylase
MLDVLVIAPHPDDAELGMGGTIALMRSQGLAVGILDLTDGEPTPLGSPEIRGREAAAATAALGIAWRENLGLPNRRLRATLFARGALAGVIRRTRPPVAVCSPLDRRPPRPFGGDAARGGGAVLGQAHQMRSAG